ncbi:MAG: hypothetical protein ABIH55_01725 [Nanoarchaeota archaeon]
MVLVIDDLVLLPLAFVGVEPVPNMFMLVFKGLHKHILEQMYPLDRIQDAIKENRMEFELGETAKTDYEKRHKDLMKQLEMAKKVRETVIEARTDLLNV